MPQGPRVLGDLMAAAIGRPAQVTGVRDHAAGFVEVDLRATAPPGGWHPGHEIQFRVTPTVSRRYSVRTVAAPDGERNSILAATHAAGPGARWLRGLRPGAEVIALAGRHRPLRVAGTRRLYVGDGSALGTIDACGPAGDDDIVAVEAPAEAIAALGERRPAYQFVAAARAPGDALQDWLVQAGGEIAGLDGALLLGHAQSIQRQRRALIDDLLLPRRAITTRPYWATGRQGL